MTTKHERDAVKELKKLLKKVEGTKIPMIIEIPPQPMHPEMITVTPDDLIKYDAEIENSNEVGLIDIGLAKDNVRTHKAYNIFQQANIHPKEYSYMGFYHIIPANEDEVSPIRFFLLW